jgi:beta-glucanase (GH16 family)
MSSSNLSIIDGGGLRISSTGVTDGGMIETIDHYLYGYFECRAKIQNGRGLWPGIWIYDKSLVSKPEIDIMERIEDSKIICTTHLNGNMLPKTFTVGDLSTDYHIFAAYWGNGKVVFYLDNVAIWETTTYIPSVPMALMLDLFPDGYLDGSTSPALFPAHFDIDYFKVWQKK